MWLKEQFVTTSDAKKNFGITVKSRRNQLGISQETLAERANLHRTYISDVERGARNLSLESMSKLARALDTSVSALFPPGGQSEAAGTVEAGDPTARLIEILLVEDNPDDVEMTLQAFKKARFANRVQVVRDGAEALDYLFGGGKYSDRQAAGSPNLVILLDLFLPKVSGLEVLRRIKADKRTARIPVVILTVSLDDADVNECLRLGAEDYIVKPVTFQRLSKATPRLNLDWALLAPRAENLGT
jgi:CheY-like chemotaxis protein/DNA-binding XRE family transcriptional regulator